MTSLTAFLESTASLIAGIGTLLAGAATLANATMRRRDATLQDEERNVRHDRVHASITAGAVIGGFLILLSLALFAGRALSAGKQALNVELTIAAWDAFNKGDFLRAIANAAKCIGEFQGAANREQDGLTNAMTPPPPTGKVSEEEQAAILSRGLLNDVATCFYITGRAAEELGRLDEARRAYESATRYTHARCWDPRGWFWSPAEVSQDRLATLK